MGEELRMIRPGKIHQPNPGWTAIDGGHFERRDNDPVVWTIDSGNPAEPFGLSFDGTILMDAADDNRPTCAGRPMRTFATAKDAMDAADSLP